MSIENETQPKPKPRKASARRAARRREDPRRNLILGLITIFVGALGFYFALTKQLPFMSKGGRMVTAYFSEPNQLQAGTTPVRVDGYQIGTVASVQAEDGGRYGKVVMRITKSNFPLHTDATAAVQFRTLLGANFTININPGSPSAPLLGSGSIPLSHTTVQTEFDDILSVFKGNTPAATQTVLGQLSSSMDGPQLRTLINVLAPSLVHTAAAFNDLRGEDQNDLSRLVSAASGTVATLSADRSDLERLVAGGSAALGAISGQRPALAAALNDAPAALNSTVAVSHSIEQTLPPLDTLVTDLGPGARELAPAANIARPTMVQLSDTLTRIQPLLSELKPAISSLSAASTPGDAVLTSLNTTFGRLNSNILPWLNSNDSALKRPIYQLIGPTFAGLGSVAAEFDSGSHVIHFPAQPELNSVSDVPCTFDGTNLLQSQCPAVSSLFDTLLGAGSSSSTSTASGTSSSGSSSAARAHASRSTR